MNKDAKKYVADHRGMAGSALVLCLERKGYTCILTHSRAELDLLDQRAAHTFLAAEKPDYVFIAAAKVAVTSDGVAAPQRPVRRTSPETR